MKAINIILYSFFVLAVVTVAGLLLATMLPIPGNIEVKIVSSGSMEPAIPTGSIVVIKPVPMYAVGEVITFGEDTKTQIPTTHRIIEVREQNGAPFYMTKGDANEEADPQGVAHREVIGKVLLSVPYAGFVIDFARKPIGFALLVGVPAAVVVFDEISKIFKEIGTIRRRRCGEPEKRDPAVDFGDDGKDASVDKRTTSPKYTAGQENRRTKLTEIRRVPRQDFIHVRSMDGVVRYLP